MNAKEILKTHFGYDEFRRGQQQIVEEIINGGDVVGIMPTGGGKSLCFQVPAIHFGGVAIVVSPLISLMQDQVMALKELGIPAAYINSSLTPRQVEMALDYAKNGKYKLVYVAPERLLSQSFLHFATNTKISMLTVDEAHCISQWGQDFRPSYLDIPKFIEKLENRPPISAFTATATKKVQDDIVKLLKLQKPQITITGFNRENLYFEVTKPNRKKEGLLSFMAKNKNKVGIVYCFSRKLVEEVCETLNKNGYNASRYHAGLSESERTKNQNDFLYDRVKIMVATNAFGMGIDKSDVGFVLHYNMPKDLESYYQEAGRAGRDGAPAICTMFFSASDVRNNIWLIENSKDVQDLDPKAKLELIKKDKKRLQIVTDYAKHNGCIRNYILEYFGEKPTEKCGNCSGCNTKYESSNATAEARQIISCISSLRERFGSGVIASVLSGSKSKQILTWRLNENSYYNGSDKSVRYLKSVIDSLVENGYITQTDSEYPTLKLTEEGKNFMRNGEEFELKFNAEEKMSKSQKFKASVEITPEDATLFDALKILRGNLAKKKHVPSYVVFSDKTLIDMSDKRPKTKEEMLEVNGVGEVKFERYGEIFLEEIAFFESKGEI
ncbi:MAG: DNA helicase RecQ [Bacillota bacterium]